MAGIFLSYRREDAGGHAGRLYDKLADRFGSELVFRDIDTLRPGSVFVEYIDASIANADVVIAMIGRDWLSATDAKGRRRLADPNDYVRFEIETALRRNVRVIPVLVRNATMPRSDELPDELSPLAQRHAFELPDQHWPFATDALLAAIEDIAPALAKPIKGGREELEGGGSSSAWEVAVDKLDISRLEPPELVERLKAVCAEIDTGRRPGETVVTLAVAMYRRLLILTSEVLEVHECERNPKKGERRKCERVVIPLSNVQRVRIAGRVSRILELYFEPPLEMAVHFGGEKRMRELVYFTSMRPRGRIDEIARYIQTKAGASV